MIYLDNAATTLQKPPAVVRALVDGVNKLGGAGRSFYTPALDAARAVEGARERVAALAGLENGRGVAFTSGATESLNLAVQALVRPGDGVITTVLEHNSVLRPLYASGCEIAWLDCDDRGMLCLEGLKALLRPGTRWVVCTHGSNLLGTLTDLGALGAFCRAHGLGLILDAAQTMGAWGPGAGDGDVICFTGHKGLYGPQGTGGILCRKDLDWRVPKTGGTGQDSFAPRQAATMPGVFEAGTPNAPGLLALGAGVDFLSETGLQTVRKREAELARRFMEGVAGLAGVTLYGPPPGEGRLPIVALNIGDLASEDAALALWERWAIATRPGSHCAPLAHRRFGTEGRGMVRFSFSWFNTGEEVDAAVEAVAALAGGR